MDLETMKQTDPLDKTEWRRAQVVNATIRRFSINGYIKEGLALFLDDLLTPSGRRHSQTLAGDDNVTPAGTSSATRCGGPSET